MRKLLVIIGSLCGSFVIRGAHQLTMRCVTPRGATIHEVTVGELVRLEVVSTAGAHQGAWPIIEGLQQAQVTGRSTRMSSTIVQGVKHDEVVYALDIQFSRPGAYTLGPARATLSSGTIISSQPLTLTVLIPSSHKTADSHETTARAQWNITTRGYVYRNEIIPCSLIFTTRDDKLQLRSVSSWSCDWNELTLPQQPEFQRTSVQGNATYEYRWEGVMIPLQAGKQWLPSIAFSYDIPSTTSWFPWSMLQANALQTVNAQPIEVTVKDLPPTQHTVAGVGVVDRVSWKNVSAEIVAGEATTLTRTIEGAFIPEHIHIAPPQTSVGVRLYISHVTVTGKYPRVRQDTEYVVQGVDAGDHHIAEQQIVFFDPAQERYVVHNSPAVSIQVKPGQKKESMVAALAPPEIDSATQQPAAAPESSDTPQSIPGHLTMIQRLIMGAHRLINLCRFLATYQLPFFIFWILFVMPLLWRIIRTPFFYWRTRAQRWYAFHKRTRRALREIKAAEREQDYIQLHAALIQYFADAIHLDMKGATSDYVQTWLMNHGASENMILAWRHFYQQLEQQAFAQPIIHEIDGITHEATTWLQLIASLKRRNLW